MKSIASRLLPFAAVAATLVSLSGSARADALPEDACTSADAGQTCENAGPSFDQSGVCTAETCQSSHPDGDGGFTTTNYDCLLCELSDAGKSDAGSGGDGGATTTRPDAGSDSAASSDSSGGCAISPGERDGATGFAMLALGIVGLALSRKKRA